MKELEGQKINYFLFSPIWKQLNLIIVNYKLFQFPIFEFEIISIL